ncbi:MAG TPA: DUF2293 domain-containing protein [Desulfobacterales bacterium]|nr:DUF2293 domain-containing protein [Desulfobacterales bacterium]
MPKRGHSVLPCKRQPQGAVLEGERRIIATTTTSGRSAAAKGLDENAVRMAVIAHIRHAETQYDELLMTDDERWDARAQVEGAVRQVLTNWEASE